MRILTWNINSVRLRLGLLAQVVAQARPDIVCLQETKVEDAHFPYETLQKMGFEHIAFAGEKSYNGVAILSRFPLTNITTLDPAKRGHQRHIAAQLPDGTWLHNCYVPAGGDIPDPALNPAFAHKLAYLEWMIDYFKHEKKSHKRAVLVGDLNIAPYEHDVWSHKQLLKVVSHTPVEVALLERLRQSLDWCDVARHFVDPSEKLYSWWSYRNRDWAASNRGRRLDHIWVTPALKPPLQHFEIYRDCRSWEQPSDHVPVLLEIAL